ncbi:MAG TPA: caspase family protein [Xanthobacteraceae bacterium]|nr:caspase family protein [Xanthobacteraceae bacterium]
MLFLYRIAAVVAVLAPLFVAPVNAQAPERRFALVIGNSEYKAGRLPTAANDAGLIAETLRTAGFDVAGARDLDQDTLRRSIREFLDKVSAAGPQAVSFIYVAGYGLQFEGENYIVPVDASIRRDEDIPIEAIRISDFTRPLAGTPGAVKLVVVDASRQHPFTPNGAPLASGLALVEPDPGMLIAFNATPGSIASIESEPYGAFAQALAEMIGTGGLSLDDLFARVRLRVNEKTNGIAVPWYASKITQPFFFTERTADAPPPPQVAASVELQSQPIRSFGGDQDAYVAAVERDTLSGYEEFIGGFPDSPLAGRVRALIAVRREAITWRRALSINTPEAYWSYLERYPQGAHVADAERRLARLAAAYDPPPSFAPMAFADVEPPPPDEVVYLSQPVVVFDGPGFLPPPPVPEFFCPPPPPEFVVLAPPPAPIGAFFLPVPVVPFISGPRPWVRPPAFVQAPPRPPIQQITINNTTIINQRIGGSTAPVSAALPSSVVTRVNSGALKAPPPAAPPPAPIKTAALPGATTLGKQVTLPTRTGSATRVPGGQFPAVTSPGNARQPIPNTAATTPGGQSPAVTSPGNLRQPVPNTAATTPGGQSPAVTSPGNLRQPVPNTAATTPGGQSPAVTSPGNLRQPIPNTAATTPTAQPGPGRRGQPAQDDRRLPGPSTATTTPGRSSPGPGATPPPPAAPQINRPITSRPPAPQPSTPQAVNRLPPPAERFAPPPPSRATSPPPPPVTRTAPPPPAARVAPPPQVARPAPPPPPAPHVAPPPPAARVAPPPPPAARPAPPPPVAHAAPPPQAVARPAAPPPPAARRCVVENGRQVCR